MKKYPSFNIDFLNCKIVIILDKDWLQIASNILKRDLKDDERHLEANAIAFSIDRIYYIATSPKIKDTILCHECFHILMLIAENFELKLTYEDHEVYAYLLEYLIEKAFEIKNRKKK